MSAGFRKIADTLKKQGESYHANIPAGWMQGRTAYGGLICGLAHSAAQSEFADLPPLRAVMVNFIGPAGAAPIFTPRLLRRGKSVSSIGVDVISDGDIAARITLTFGASRESSVEHKTREQAVLKRPSDCPRFTPLSAIPFVPKYFSRFETRLISGARPLAGDPRGYTNAFSRHADKNSRGGIGSLVVLGDVLPPPALVTVKKLGPISSVTWALNILTDDPQTEQGWWRVDSRLTAASDGYASQEMGIWNLKGEKIAQAMQCVAVFV